MSETTNDEPMLFPESEIPQVAVPAAEHSIEAREWAMLKAIEAVRFDPNELAAYEARLQETGLGFARGHGRDFLDFCLWQLGGRSQ